MGAAHPSAVSGDKAVSIAMGDEAVAGAPSKRSLRSRLRLPWRKRSELPDSQPESDLTREKKTLAALTEWSLLPMDLALACANSHPSGLDPAIAAHRLQLHGPNRLSTSSVSPWWYLLLHNIANPFNALLAIMAIIAGATGDWTTAIILLTMIVLSVALGFAQELRSARHISHLKAQIKDECLVLRPAQTEAGFVECRVPREVLVQGDIVSLVTGSIVPADCLILASDQLSISQSSLTGENQPQEKRPDDFAPHAPATASTIDRPNLVFLGSHVLSGSGRALVLETGDRTYMGAMAGVAEQAEADARTLNSFRQGVTRVSLLLLVFMLVMTPTVFVIEGLVSHDWENAALFVLAVAVGLVPEMLPMILNANLARGAVVLAKEHAIVKRLDAVQTMGAVDVLCSDKTGTLTEDRVGVSTSLDAFGNLSELPLELAYVNAKMLAGGNAIDRAIIERIETDDEESSSGRELMHDKVRLAEVPFDFYRRRVSTVFSYLSQPSRLTLVCKGAADEVLRSCTAVRRPDGSIFPIDVPEVHLQILRMAERGERVVGVASRDLAPSMLPHCHATPELEVEMILEGFLTVLDPPKEDAREAVAGLRALGVETKVLTGDALPTARRICEMLEVIPPGPEGEQRCIDGAQLAELKRDDFAAAVSHHTVFARLTPIQKLEIVRVLRQGGRRVAFLGDGVNDCPALRGADCGLSVDTACDTAKDAASVILLDKRLGVILDCVRTGRRSFANTIMYIRMAASSNLGNVLSILIASAWLPFTPMAAVQILTQNLLYDVSQASIPWDNVDEVVIASPVDWSTRTIARFMLLIGPISSPFDVATFIINWFFFRLRSSHHDVATFQTHWFLAGLTTQILVVHVLRTPKIPLIQSRASLPVTLTTLGVGVVGLVIPFTPLAHLLKMTRPRPLFFAFLAGIVVAYAVVLQLAKMAYLRVFKTWL